MNANASVAADAVEERVFQAVLNDELLLKALPFHGKKWIRALASESAKAARAETIKRIKEIQ